jgi:hypothetical protein
VTIDAGEFQRFHVTELGTVTLVEASPPTRLQCWGNRLVWAGWLLWGAGIVGVGIASSENLPAGWALVPLVIGGSLFVGGATLADQWSNLSARLKSRHESVDGWHVAPDLNGWTAETTWQLASVEELAEGHDGRAFVQEIGGGQVEVLVRRKFSLWRHWVDRSGNTGPIGRSRAGLHSLSWNARRLNGGGGSWIEIRTEIEASD